MDLFSESRLILLSTLVGALLLALFCISDYRRRVRRTTSRLLYSLALLLFLIFNLSVYLLLVVVFAGNAGPLTDGVQPEADVNTVLIPILVAVLYFGAGAATIPLFGKEFGLYDKVIEAFIHLFHFVIDSADVRHAIIESKDEYRKYKESLDALHREAGPQGWDQMADEWKDIQEESKFVEDHVRDLEAMRVTLEADHTVESLHKVLAGVGEKTIELRKRLIQRLKYHLYSFILMNAKTQDDVRHMLEGLPEATKKIDEMIRPAGPDPRDKWGAVQSLLVGGFFGFFVGLVVMLDESNRTFLTPWIAATACSLFMLIFHFAMKVRDPVSAGALGGLAGWSGFVVWVLLANLAVHGTGLTWGDVRDPLTRSTIGVLYGVASGLLLFLFRSFVCKRTEHCVVRIILVSAMGAAAFATIAAIVPWLFRIQGGTSYGDLLRMAVIGAVFFIGMAHATRLLNRRST